MVLKILPATVDFVDIAGIVKGASEGEGLGNQFLANIRESSAIAQVVRVFEDSMLCTLDGQINPASDMETINTELVLADMQTLERHSRIEKKLKVKARQSSTDAMLAAQTVRRARKYYLFLHRIGKVRDGAPTRAQSFNRKALHIRIQFR